MYLNMTEISKMGLGDLGVYYDRTVALRELVLEWAKDTGYSASQLVSRTAEHDIEQFFGRLKLEERH